MIFNDATNQEHRIKRSDAGFDRIPAELRSERRWLVWNHETVGGRRTKVPFCALDPDRRASSTDENTWSDFFSAVACVEENSAEGIGFVLGSGYVGVDLDACRDPRGGKRTELADDAITTLRSYTEASPSGNGIHILLRAALPDGWRRRQSAEIYSDGRFFTMTGQVLGIWHCVEDRTAELAELHARLDGTLAHVTRTVIDPSEQLIRQFDSSDGRKNVYTAKVHRTSGKSTCNCRGWKNRFRSGHACWHVQELADELGIEAQL